MGSTSDLPTMEAAIDMLKEFEIPYTVRVLSAHRTPNETLKLAEEAKDNGIRVFIAGAGGAAHLAGVIASSTPLPVIGVPMQTSALGGLDSAFHCSDAGRNSCCDNGNRKGRRQKCGNPGCTDDRTGRSCHDEKGRGFQKSAGGKVLANFYPDM